MNPLALKAIGAILLVLVMGGVFSKYRHSLIQQGVTQESARRDKQDQVNRDAANAEKAALDAKLAAAELNLKNALAMLDGKYKELQNEQVKSSGLQRDLAAERVRYTVLVNRHPAQASNAGSTVPAGVGQGASFAVDLDGGVAANLEWLRSTREQAIERLGACVAAYDSVKTAADSIR